MDQIVLFHSLIICMSLNPPKVLTIKRQKNSNLKIEIIKPGHNLYVEKVDYSKITVIITLRCAALPIQNPLQNLLAIF